LGIANDGPPQGIALRVADARHHIHVQGVTGVGKSTWLANHVLAEAHAGRGVVLLDCQGDLALHVLDRLPASAGDRLVILDPAETEAPPAWNVLAPLDPDQPTRDTETGQRDNEIPHRDRETAWREGETGREWAAENVVGVFRRLYAAWWGPRMDDVLRAACLTLVRQPGSTLAEVVSVLTRPEFRRAILTTYGEPEGLDGFWEGYDALSAGQRNQLAGPVLSRLRSVLSRRFARDLLGTARSTINLTDILNGGILIARIPKGEIGEHAAQLVGSLLLSGLWSAATRRSGLAPEQRRDATIVVDECHNFLHLPIGVDDALAEARGYRVSLVLAHQHLAQLPPDVRDAVDANARNKILFTVSPNDATKLVRHVAPYFDDSDLARRPAFEVVARTVHHGHDVPPFTLAAQPLPPAIPGRAEQLRATARRRTGLTAEQRARATRRRHVGTAPRATRLGAGPVPTGNRNEGGTGTVVPGQSSGPSAGQSPADQRVTYDWPTE
jgi:type IV secretory pathway TraG/TraD family ATPase VirD4